MGSGSYILRVWLEPSVQNSWRASVIDLQTNKKVYFSSPAALVRFLAERLEGDGLKVLEYPKPPNAP